MRFVPLALAAALVPPAAAAVTAPSGLPPRLQAPAGEEPAFMLTASGAHVFECKPGAGPTGFTWSFVAPDATYREGERTAATQSAPNLWESSNDRSSVTGALRDTIAVGDGDLPWAVFEAQPLAEDGLFAGVTTIQRVNTAGGVAPSAACDAGDAGRELRVPFTADYYFYRRAAAAPPVG